MARGVSPWRVLRPALLAGAATLTWLAFSATAATAETTDSSSLLGGVTSPVTSLAVPLAGTLVPAPADARPATAQRGLLESPIGSSAGTADHLAAALPVISDALPAGIIAGLTVPVAVAADDAATALVAAITSPPVDAVPVLAPVIEPGTDRVTGTSPLPVALPDLPALLERTVSSEGVIEAPAAEAHPAAAPSAAPAGDTAGIAAAGGQSNSSGTPQTPPSTAATSPASAVAATGADGTGLSSPGPAFDPAQPSSASGGVSGSSSGSAAAAAWLDDFDVELPRAGAFPAGGSPGHGPSPVSFDPGSFPD